MQVKKITIKHYFEGLPKLSDFELIEETIPDILSDGEILIKGEYFSVDPYMRAFGNRDKVNVGDTMLGSQVALVLKSRHSKYPEGSKVLAYVGWRDHTICNPDKLKGMYSMILPLPDLKGLPDSYALGPCGMTGLTAYFGFLKLCEPKKGEVVVVNSAAGAVGSIVGQIAKIRGCKVVGFAGNDEKVNWIKDDLKFNFAFNYKQVHLDSILKKFCLEGVDCYFDNVGGEFSYTVLKNMNNFGRVALCGSLSQYNNGLNTENKVYRLLDKLHTLKLCEIEAKRKHGKILSATIDSDKIQTTLVKVIFPRHFVTLSFDYFNLVCKQIKMEGFNTSRWVTEFEDGVKQMATWIHEGKIIIRETHTKGFENMPQAFIDLLEGKSMGKAIVVL